MTDVPDEAVEAVTAVLIERGVVCDSSAIAHAALTAAAPHIAEAQQALADLRAGIEALRDKWRAGRCACLTCTETRRHADALDALLRGA